MSSYVLNVVTTDHPGIIAGVSTALYELDANIESCSQTVLDGYFTFILVVTLPEQWNADDLALHIRSHRSLGEAYKVVAVAARDTIPSQTEPQDADTFVITAFGKDTKGVVHDFSRYLADQEINILDFYSRCEGDEFTLVAQVRIPNRHSIAVLQDDLEAIAQERNYTIRLQHNNIFVATNDIRLYH
ncbi:MAG: hypothetical protein LBJ67_11495 [Planctomycetaceae bacterium]|jgi:predicted amino acid-binding ACT domain protein|nr:hypothetical protein [Planctomycetaceae bacterium]